MQGKVLDSSALLVAIQAEPGHDKVLDLTGPVFVSAVNMAEVRSKLIDHGISLQTAQTLMGLIGAVVVEFNDADATQCAALRESTRSGGLSLGDRACLSLAVRLDAAAMTADRQWAKLDLPVSVELIR
jgi:PIN domain nuclease of toxin-antitoxin system